MIVKLMAWLPIAEDGEKVLHLKYRAGDRWTLYTALCNRDYAKRDYQIPTQHGVQSKGYATAQALLKQGWSYVQTDVAIEQVKQVEKIKQ